MLDLRLLITHEIYFTQVRNISIINAQKLKFASIWDNPTQENEIGTGELRALAALAEDQGFVHSTHIDNHNSVELQFQGNPTPFYGLWEHQVCTWYTEMCAGKHSHT